MDFLKPLTCEQAEKIKPLRKRLGTLNFNILNVTRRQEPGWKEKVEQLQKQKVRILERLSELKNR